MLAGHGHYMGTEIGSRWWKRYRGTGYFARGKGSWRLERGVFVFQRLLLSAPVRVPLAQVYEVRTGAWHAGQWAGGKPVVKLLWRRDGLDLGSGFVLARSREASLQLVAHLAAEADRAAGGQPHPVPQEDP